MDILHAIVLGIVQGLTEFLPISSSGHLELVPWLFGWEDFADPQVGLAFDTALHLGTLVGVVAYLRRELVPYVRHGVLAVVSPKRADKRVGLQAWLFVASAVPAGLVGVIFEDDIAVLGEPAWIAVSLIGFGLVLWWADRLRGSRTSGEFTLVDSLLIGLAQILALNPGTSRSGITITMARMRGFDRDAAARVSFLMSIPVIGGAVVFQIASLVSDGIPDGLLAPMIVGIIAAAISGWCAIWGMMRLLRFRSFGPFVTYRVLVGIAVLGLVAAGFRG
jgi:undecaprenyl-diphosphatase